MLNPDGTVRGDGSAASSEYESDYLAQGMRYSVSTGTYATETRIYSPSLGRFDQEDPDGYVDGSNTYQGYISNPVNNVDPTGTDAVVAGVGTASGEAGVTAVGTEAGGASITGTAVGGEIIGTASSGAGAVSVTTTTTVAASGGTLGLGSALFYGAGVPAAVAGYLSLGYKLGGYAWYYGSASYMNSQAGKPTHVVKPNPKPAPAPRPSPYTSTANGNTSPPSQPQQQSGKGKLPIFHVYFHRTFWIAGHDAWAILYLGKPFILTYNGGGAAKRSNRYQACKGLEGLKNDALNSLDEYPFASTTQGGAGASVWPVPSDEQDEQGTDFWRFLSQNHITTGQSFIVEVEP